MLSFLRFKEKLFSPEEIKMKVTSKNKLAMATCLFIFTAVLSACETADDNSLEKARSCIDGAAKKINSDPTGAQTQAATCDAMVANMTTPESGKIGFGAMLILEGKFTQIPALVTALQGQQNTMATAVTFLVYTSGTAAADVGKTSLYATRSASTGIQKISGFISLANTLSNIGTVTTIPQVQAVVAGLTPGNANIPGSNENTIATNLVSLQQSTCAGAGATSSNCKNLTGAVGNNTSDLTAVITAFKVFIAAGN
jgi:hypothetical protein